LNASQELESKEVQQSMKSLKDPHLISIDLLSLICHPLVLFKAKSLLYNALYLPSLSPYSPATSVVSLYNNYKDDSLLTLVSNTFKLKQIQNSIDCRNYFNTFDDYLDQVYDFETFQKVLITCKSLIQQHRANNLVKFLNDKFNVATNGQKHFIVSLNSLFWRIVNRAPLNNNSLNSIGQPSVLNHLSLTIEPLIEIMHSFLLVEFTSYQANASLSSNSGSSSSSSESSFSSSTTVNLIVDCYLRLLCSNNLDINFASRHILLQLVKPPKKSASSSSSLTTSTTIITSSSTSNLSTSKATSSSNKSSKASSNALATTPTSTTTTTTLPTSAPLNDVQPSVAPIDEAVRFNLNQNESFNNYMELEENVGAGGTGNDDRVSGVSGVNDLLVEDVNQDQEISNEAIAAIINNSIAPAQNVDHANSK
jgi:hypothetical protein